MPIQIKELVIKAVCGENNNSDSGQSLSSNKEENSFQKLSYTQKKQIIDECTAEVVERLKRMNEF